MAGVYQIKDKDKKINELIKMFKLDEVLNKRSKTLSGGWQRKVSIAISLINDPKILFLDEPTLGLDVIARKELWKVIYELKGKITIILTTHYMEEAESLSDRIGIMTYTSGFESFIFRRTMKGIQLLIDTYESTGDEYTEAVKEFGYEEFS